MRMYDGKNPYGSEGGYVVPSRGRLRGRRRGRRGDRGMEEYGYDGRVMRSYPTIHPSGDYRGDMNYDMRREERYGRDGHYMYGRQSEYEPVEFMGYCQGYYGSPERADYGREREYVDMKGAREYGYRDYGDYGETLSEREIEQWERRLLSQLDERERQMFHKDAIIQKFKSMGKSMDGFGEKELYITTLMIYTDYKNTIGQNPDLTVKLAYDWLSDKDVAVKGAEKLAVYYDCIVEGE